MAEKITLKNMLANLPQKTDVDTVVGRDASGNPVYIKKADLAQVVAELMPLATLENKGLLSQSLFGIIQQKEIPNATGDEYYRIINNINSYVILEINGVSSSNAELIRVAIMLSSSKGFIGYVLSKNKEDTVCSFYIDETSHSVFIRRRYGILSTVKVISGEWNAELIMTKYLGDTSNFKEIL